MRECAAKTAGQDVYKRQVLDPAVNIGKAAIRRGISIFIKIGDCFVLTGVVRPLKAQFEAVLCKSKHRTGYRDHEAAALLSVDVYKRQLQIFSRDPMDGSMSFRYQEDMVD